MATYDYTVIEDAAHSSGDRLYPVAAVRNDTAATTLTDANGDYSPIAVDEKGRVFLVVGTGASDLAKAEDSVHANGDVGIMALAVRGDFGAASGAAGDYVVLPVGESSSIAGLQVHVVGDSDKYVRGSQAHNAALTVGPVAIGAYGSTAAPTAVGADGNLTYIWADRNGRIRVTGDASMTALKIEGTTAAGTGSATAILTIQGVSSMTPVVIQGVSTMTPVYVTGELAHDAVDSGNPNKLGMKALAHGTNPTAVAANNRTQLYANRHGIPWVIGGHPNVLTLEYLTTGAQTDAAIITAAAGTKIVITQIQVNVDVEVTVSPQVRIGFGTTTTPITTGVVFSHPGMGIGAGGLFIVSASRGDGSGIIAIGADGQDLRITCGAPTTGEIRVVVSYYTIES